MISRARGLTTPGAFKNLWDYNFGIGGPIMKDRLWYFGQLRQEGYKNTVPGMFANQNAENPNAWTYVARPVAARLSGRLVQYRRAPPHRAAQCEEQGQHLVG